MKKPTTAPLNDEEHEWVQAQLEALPDFLALFVRTEPEGEVSAEMLDTAYTAWCATSPTDVDQINDVINVVGLAFGQILVDELDFEWVVATDDRGTELAVHRGETMFFPAGFVAKRWERKETGFLASTLAELRRSTTRPS